MSGRLLENLLLFGRMLRAVGLDVHPGRMVDLVQALEHVSIGRRSDFYHAARSLLVHRREDLERFDRAFEAFWRKPRGPLTRLDLAALGEKRRFAPSRAAEPKPGPPLDTAEAIPSSATRTVLIRDMASAAEVLRAKDFAELTDDERGAVRQLAQRLVRSSVLRRSRRRRPGRGTDFDLRRTLRASLRRGGEVLDWMHREPKLVPRPLVVLADISGSMEPYTRLLLLFLCGLAGVAGRRSEAFVFGTRLTRITRQMRGRDPERAIADASRAVPDWSGGTRIGEALHAFNRIWARRVPRGAIVLLLSDGWDRGDPDLLRREVARLQRTCHRLVWLNPLLGSADYQPLARGMRAALPYVDDFLPVHNLASLDGLARRLESLPSKRPARRQTAGVISYQSSVLSNQN